MTDIEIYWNGVTYLYLQIQLLVLFETKENQIVLLLSEAVSRPSWERNVGKGIPLLWVLGEKSVRIKSLGVWVNGWITMEERFAKNQICSCRDCFSVNEEILPEVTGDEGNTGVESRTTNTNTVQSDPATTWEPPSDRAPDTSFC